MTETATSDPANRGTRPRRWLWNPPGVAFYAATVLLAALALWVSSVGSIFIFMLPMFWFPFCCAWFVRLGGAVVATGFEMRPFEWIRWFAVPVILGIAFVVTTGDVPFNTRLALSRGAMDQVAADVMAGGSTDRSTIGQFEVEQVERIPNGMRFLVSTMGFIDRMGFAYSTEGSPADPDGHATYKQLDGGWWIWIDRFD